MPGLDGLIFKLWDPLNSVSKKIEQWTPPIVNSEKEIEESLFNYLSTKFPNLSIRKQFSYDRIRADLLIENTVAVEIKLNLISTVEFQRLIGQLEGYARWGKNMIVLIVGKIEPDLKYRVQERLDKDWDFDSGKLIHIRSKEGT